VDHAAPHLTNPRVSPHVYIETGGGTIELELDVLDAPLTAESFTTLARQGFFDGLTFHRVAPGEAAYSGDPRSDDRGGAGFTLRDEPNQLPFLRGTVGLARDLPDTGGSRFFIAHSPQPRLDGRYTAFGRVVAGMEVVDALQTGERIERVLVWDGVQPLTGADGR
jgi:cyclophilin family peptidyl-prolyl cis-trans isomerase